MSKKINKLEKNPLTKPKKCGKMITTINGLVSKTVQKFKKIRVHGRLIAIIRGRFGQDRKGS